jgi:hypothetical protein
LRTQATELRTRIRNRESTVAFFSPAWRAVLLAGLATLVLVKGIAPAMSGLSNDFPSYFTAAKLVTEGADLSGLYDDVWFREQMRRYGLEPHGKFAPFPPPTALLLVPLARLEPLSALRIVTAISVLCLVCSVFLLARLLAWQVTDSALFILLSSAALLSGLRYGQPYILASTLCILGYYLYLNGRPWLAGISFGLVVPIKYYSVIILALFGVQREWRVLSGGGVAILGIGLLSIAVLGWKVHEIFLVSVLGNHLTAHLSLQAQTTQFTSAYQSFDTLFNRLFILDADNNPQPLLAAPLLRTFGVITVKSALALLAATTLIKLARNRPAEALGPSIGILGILTLLIAPATASYTFALLWLPIALLIHYFLRNHAYRAAYFVLGAYALIGFIPFLNTGWFDGRGALTVLAYPRLWVLTAMFIGCAYLLLRKTAHEDHIARP